MSEEQLFLMHEMNPHGYADEDDSAAALSSPTGTPVPLYRRLRPKAPPLQISTSTTPPRSSPATPTTTSLRSSGSSPSLTESDAPRISPLPTPAIRPRRLQFDSPPPSPPDTNKVPSAIPSSVTPPLPPLSPAIWSTDSSEAPLSPPMTPLPPSGTIVPLSPSFTAITSPSTSTSSSPLPSPPPSPPKTPVAISSAASSVATNSGTSSPERKRAELQPLPTLVALLEQLKEVGHDAISPTILKGLGKKARPPEATTICPWHHVCYDPNDRKLYTSGDSSKQRANEARVDANEEDNPGPPNTERLKYLSRAKRYYKKADYISATEMYNAATAVRSRQALPYFKKAIELTNVDPAKALLYYKAALLVNPHFLSARYYQATLLFQQGKYEEAEKAYQAMLEEIRRRMKFKERHTINWRSHFNFEDSFDKEARLYSNQARGMHDGVLQYMTVVRHYCLTLTKLSKHKNGAALVLAYYPEYLHHLSIDASYEAGFIFSVVGDLKKAHEAFSHAARGNAKYKKSLLAIIHGKEASLAADDACFEVPLASRKNNPQYALICDALRRYGAPSDNGYWLVSRVHLAIHPTVAGLVDAGNFLKEYWGVIQSEVDGNISPETVYKIALKIDPHYVPAYEGLISLLSRLDRPYQAVEACDALLAIAPSNSYAREMRPKLRAKVDMCDSKLKACEQKLSVRPRNGALYRERGHLLAQQGKRPEAIQAYLTAVALKEKVLNERPIQREEYHDVMEYFKALALRESIPRDSKEAFRRITGWDYDTAANIGSTLRDLQIFSRSPQKAKKSQKAGFFSAVFKKDNLSKDAQLVKKETKSPTLFQPAPQERPATQGTTSAKPPQKPHNEKSEQSENDQLTDLVLSYVSDITDVTVELPEDKSSKCVVQ